MTFAKLDVEAVKQADQQGNFIKQTGKYKGKFTKAEVLTAKTGTIGIGFTFESDDKQTVNFSIYIEKSDGEKLLDYKTLNSIMACLRTKTVSSPVMGEATKYDFDAKKEVKYQAPLLLDLMNKPIGVVLQLCEYAKEKDRVPTGEYGWKIEIQGAFEASTELTGGEIIAKKSNPEVLQGIIARLSDRPLKNKNVSKSVNQGTGKTHNGVSSNIPDFDDLNDGIDF